MNAASNTDQILSQETPEELFRTLIQRAGKNLSVKLNEMGEYYLVSLLAQSLTGIKTTTSKSGSRQNELSLAEELLSSHSKSETERRSSLRCVGDRALMVSGYYTESLLRKTVRPGYYHSIGKSAYASVAEMKGRGHLDSLFRDLSSRFETYVSLLAEVSEFAAFRKKRSLSERYSKWFHTRNPTVHKEMIEMGLFPSLGSLEIQ